MITPSKNASYPPEGYSGYPSNPSEEEMAKRYESIRDLLPETYYDEEDDLLEFDPFEVDSDPDTGPGPYARAVDNSNNFPRPPPSLAMMRRWDQLLGIHPFPVDTPPPPPSPLATSWPEGDSDFGQGQDLGIDQDPDDLSFHFRLFRNDSDQYQIFPLVRTTTTSEPSTAAVGGVTTPGDGELTFIEVMDYVLSFEKLLIVLVAGFILGWLFAKCCSRRKSCCGRGVAVGVAPDGEVGNLPDNQNQHPGHGQGQGGEEALPENIVREMPPAERQRHRERLAIYEQRRYYQPRGGPSFLDGNGNRPGSSGSRPRRSYLDHPRVVVPRGYGPHVRQVTRQGQGQSQTQSQGHSSQEHHQAISTVTGRHVLLPPSHLRGGLLQRNDYQTDPPTNLHYEDEGAGV